MSACTTTQECVTYDSDGVITSNKCNDPNNSCFCNGSTCTSGTCTDDSYCQTNFGSDSKCTNTGQGYSSCSNAVCSTNADCPINMVCNGGKCTTVDCTSNKDCAQYTECMKAKGASTGYCVMKQPPNLLVILMLVLLAIASVVGLYYYYKKRKSG